MADGGDRRLAQKRSKSGAGGEPPQDRGDGSAVKGRGKRGGGDGGGGGNVPQEEPAALHEVAQTRYLNYALSVITSRALPDVRDGLKPVQRRIMYTMWQQGLRADAKHRKCAKVVGDVMGNFHPHGDASIYDALVRMAQPFSLRVLLVDGSGNFGSLDGDGAAAMRYTECRLAPLAHELLEEIEQDTVHFRPNYDGTREEPVVLPAAFPNLLVNGATGIAVGMATNIPPHNPEEVVNGAIRLLDALVEGKQLSARELSRTIKGPDFPTGGQLVSSVEEIKHVYETGQGTLKLRGTWKLGAATKTGQIVQITSIPYTVNKSDLVERIADVALSRKMPLLVDVKDVSTDDICIELELKKEAEPQKVLAYLFKHTPLQINFAVNMTCLVPTENPEVGRPERIDLAQMLWHFLHFRLDVVTRRLGHELRALAKRIHVLEGFEKVFDALDQIIKIIRASEGKADAAQKIMAKFKLDAEQTDAILELKLYRLARLEILIIQKELKEKRKRSKEIKALLDEQEGKGRWSIVRTELTELLARFGKDAKRRTQIQEVGEEAEFSAEELIIAEDAYVLVTADGWVKRQKEIKDLGSTRLREGDAVLACELGSTRATIVFLSNLGTAYSGRIIDVPATAGYGEPIQKLFKLKDGERIIAAISLDPRVIGDIAEREGKRPKAYGVAATSDGYSLSFGLSPFAEPSTRAGRRYAKPAEGMEVVGVGKSLTGKEIAICATKQRRALLAPVEDVNYLNGPGKGVVLIKLDDDDQVVGFKVAKDKNDALVLESSGGGERKVSAAEYKATGRGGKGHEVLKRGNLVRAIPTPPEVPAPLES
jgi:DNA gyrase subunit A